jgi:hypothetical protein
MIGCAAESMILDLRDSVVNKLGTIGQAVPSKMGDWIVKTVSDAIHAFLSQRKSQFSPKLCAASEANWSAFAFQIRTTRNDAGHPASIEPITADAVHASLLIFPQLARLTNQLASWVAGSLV